MQAAPVWGLNPLLCVKRFRVVLQLCQWHTECAGGRQVVLLPAAPGTCDDTVTSVCLRTLELHRWSCTVGFAGSRQWRQSFGHALPAPGFLWGARGQAVGCWVTTAGLSQHRLCVGSLPWGERALQFSPPLEQHSSVAGSAHSGVFLVLRPPPCARWDLVTSTCRSDTVVGGCATVKTGRRAVRLQAAPVWGLNPLPCVKRFRVVLQLCQWHTEYAELMSFLS